MKPREPFSINASHSLQSVHDAEASGEAKWVVWGQGWAEMGGGWCEWQALLTTSTEARAPIHTV